MAPWVPQFWKVLWQVDELDFGMAVASLEGALIADSSAGHCKLLKLGLLKSWFISVFGCAMPRKENQILTLCTSQNSGS